MYLIVIIGCLIIGPIVCNLAGGGGGVSHLLFSDGTW